MTETIAAGSAAGQDGLPEQDRTPWQIGSGQADTGQDRTTGQAEAVADLRRTGINPDFWYPVAVSASVRKKKTSSRRCSRVSGSRCTGARAARSTRSRTAAPTARSR